MTAPPKRLSRAMVHRLFSVLLLAGILACVLPAQADTKDAKLVTLAEVEAKQVIVLTSIACLLTLDGNIYCWAPDSRIAQKSIPLQQVDLGKGNVATNIYGGGLYIGT